MDCKELMIGDKVLVKVLSQIPDTYAVHTWTAEDYLRDLLQVKPIELTPEILEKNGWKEAQFWHEYKDGKNTIQSCLPDMRGIINGVEIQHFKCDYVHQYQHLLRDCRLNDIADNFKIE